MLGNNLVFRSFRVAIANLCSLCLQYLVLTFFPGQKCRRCSTGSKGEHFYGAAALTAMNRPHYSQFGYFIKLRGLILHDHTHNKTFHSILSNVDSRWHYQIMKWLSLGIRFLAFHVIKINKVID